MNHLNPDPKQESAHGIPVWEKFTLTLTEAAQYTGIGQHKLCELADEPDCEFIFWVGRKRLFKRRKLEEFIEKTYSV